MPVSQLLGQVEGQGFYQMMSALDRGRIYMAGASVGIARASWKPPPAMPRSGQPSATRSGITRRPS
jgi:hypothetical protein